MLEGKKELIKWLSDSNKIKRNKPIGKGLER